MGVARPKVWREAPRTAAVWRVCCCSVVCRVVPVCCGLVWCRLKKRMLVGVVNWKLGAEQELVWHLMVYGDY